MPKTVKSAGYLRSASVPIVISLGLILVFFTATALLSYNNIRVLRQNTLLVSRTHDTLISLQGLMAAIKDAETGQRGYLLTGDKQYLLPYEVALNDINSRMATVEQMIAGNEELNADLAHIKNNLNTKLAELAETIEVRRTAGVDAAVALVKTDSGKQAMDNIRSHMASMEAYEKGVRKDRIADKERVYRSALLNILLSCITGVFLAIAVFTLLRKNAAARLQQAWLNEGENKLSRAVMGNLTTEELGKNILTFFAEYLKVQVGAFYTRNGDTYKLVATYGVRSDSDIPPRFGPSDGLLAEAAYQGRILSLDNVPDGYLNVGSSMGQSKPRHLVIVPTATDDTYNAVIELGSFDHISEDDLALLKQAGESIGVAVRAAEYRSHLQSLLEETQRQAEELQTQSEELRVSNEELEEQGRVLKESQSRLEQQQYELEQINSQLEEQTQQLEAQKEELEHAHASVQAKAHEVQQASQYKSDFLANMSHELRTPLNSSLILAKLLADNPTGNLTEEQVKFAMTIQSSGNDLLTLINDILDLSKIEAGHMDLIPEDVSLKRLADDMKRVFEPMAKEKKLDFGIVVDPGCPDTIHTDRLRLEQVIKNLLANALKFTEAGRVDVVIANDGSDRVAVAVRDTGIGISPEQQNLIFDAFRQADSTTSRKYGGTGLGLSISRELTRLLGGNITLSSTLGEGSTFTIHLPLVYNENLAQKRTESGADAIAISPVPATPVVEKSPAPAYRRMDDDRDRLSKNRHCIMVIEDDPSFAGIIYDLAKDMGFDCLIAQTAEQALIEAKQYLPNAIILDVGLPDNSGLSVLDRLKRSPHTRHIPVHVVSASDYTQTALSLGAIGYMLKPIKREQLADALRQMETRFLQSMRRILLVEDDEVQRDSVNQLLKSKDVEIVGVGTAAECLDKLRDGTFDCMVLDLSLPDSTGYELLETLSKGDDYSFPPVIVYTGRDLSANEEQLLRRYSKSIIIKGAKSPERLLDEVTLFLHQVVTDLPVEQQNMLKKAQSRDSILENKRILIVEDDIRNIYSLTNILEPHGVVVQIARNGLEAIGMLEKANDDTDDKIDMVLMDVMMPEMDGITATREIRKRREWKKLPIIMLTAKAMRDDQERCLASGANDYMAKPLDVEKLLSLVRVWMPR